jgi:hypothetical protein
VQELNKKLEQLPIDSSDEKIEQTLGILKGYNYDPILILDAPDFLKWKNEDLVKEFKRLDSLDKKDPQLSGVKDLEPLEVVAKQKELLLYHYQLLGRLREGDSEAWDIVYELYEDD